MKVDFKVHIQHVRNTNRRHVDNLQEKEVIIRNFTEIAEKSGSRIRKSRDKWPSQHSNNHNFL